MRIISTKDAVFQKIAEALGSRQEETQLETLAGIDCDEEDLQNQQELGEEDPIVTIELIAHGYLTRAKVFLIGSTSAYQAPKMIHHRSSMVDLSLHLILRVKPLILMFSSTMPSQH